MRKSGTIVAAGLLVVGLAACSSSSGGSSAGSSASGAEGSQSPGKQADLGPIVYAGSGGSAGKVIADEIKKFTAQTGIKVDYVQDTTSVNFAKVVAQKNDPQIDVLLVNPSDLKRGAAMNLFAAVDETKVPNIKDLYDALPATQYGVPQHLAVEGFAYNTEKFKEAGIPPLTSIQDLYNPKLKGKIALSPPNGNFGINALVMFARANGGDENNIKPGFEALKKLKDIGNWALTPQSSSAGDALMSQGTAWVNYTSTKHQATLAAQGLPIAFAEPKETGGVAELSLVAAVANAGHLEASYKLIDFLISQEVQVSQAAEYEGPVIKNADLSPDVAKGVPYGDAELNSILQLDDEAIAKKKGDWVAQWHRELD